MPGDRLIRTFLVLASIAAIPACSAVLGIEDVVLSEDASTTSPDAPPDHVTGRWDDVYVTPSGETTVARDLTSYVLQIYIPDSGTASGYRVIETAGSSDGSFEFGDVPPGITFALKVIAPESAQSSWYFTDQRRLQLGTRIAGRPDAQPSGPGTTIEVDLLPMQPWVDATYRSDHLEVGSFGAATLRHTKPDPAPAQAATTLTGSIAWHDAFDGTFRRPRLIDGSAGDDLHVAHIRTEAQPYNRTRRHTLTRVLDAFSTNSFSTIDGNPNLLSGAFSTVPMDRSMVLRATYSAFEDQYTPLASSFGIGFTWSASPYGSLAENGFTSGLTLFSLTESERRLPEGTSLFQFDATYGDPYPAEWVRYLYQSHPRIRYFRAPGAAGVGLSIGGYVRVFTPSGAIPAAPDLAPPTSVLVGGVDISLGGRVAFDGASPVSVTWTPSSGASFYDVFVQRVYANGTRTTTETMAVLRTQASSIDIPAEVFSSGSLFAFTIRAAKTSSGYSDGVLRALSFPQSRAMVPGGMFRIDVECGDSDVDPGEDCDAAGVSTASCDADCSAPVCGDGFRNADAGETCDTARDTISCDADCTTPQCGDGYTNRQVEDCDDGNTVDDGNGCDASCRASNFCFDGVIQGAVEACDDGNGADDDGCSATCEIEPGFTCTGEPSVCTPT